MKNVYLLTEIFEGSDGVREFQIIDIFENEDKAIGKMEELISSDEYGLIDNNGVFIHEKHNFSTNYICGFIEYSIDTRNVVQ